MGGSKGKKTAPKAPKRGRLKRLMKKAGWLIAALLVVVGALMVRNYHRASIAGDVESILGELSPEETISLRVSSRGGADRIIDELKKAESRSFGTLILGELSKTSSSYAFKITLADERYDVEIYWEEDRKPPTPPKPPEPPTKPRASKPYAGPEARLAIVIDDLGAKLDVAKRFLELPFPVTPAVMPFQPQSRETAELSASMNRPFIIHMPMEPSRHGGAKFTPDMITSGADPERVKKLIDEALSTVPGASGLNNHMGSKATEAAPVMEAVMAELKKRDMYFLDSMTSAKSVGASQAKKAGLPWAARDVFLDNELNVNLIDAQIAKAVERAHKNGQAIAIGHGHPETLEALKRWSARFKEKGIKVVPVKELMRDGV